MKPNTPALLLIPCVLFMSCALKTVTLNDFIFDQDSLPENCTIIKPSADNPLPANIPDNPYISSDTSFTHLAAFLLHTDSLNASIQTGLFSVYQCRNEIGINGMQFRTAKDAEACEAILNAVSGDTTLFSVFRRKNIVIYIWRDDIADSCYDDFKKLIQDRLNR